MKRICMVAYTYYKYDPRVIREAESLASRNDLVDFICLKKPGLLGREKINGVNILRVNMAQYRGSSPVFYILSYFNFFVKATIKLFFLFLIKKYHIIHVHTMPDFLVFVSFIPKLCGAKVILDIHDLVPELYMSKFTLDRDSLIIRLLLYMEKRSIGFAHKAIAVHKPHLKAIVNHGNPERKFITLLNVPDPAIFTLTETKRNKKPDKTIFLYHGTISKRHGLETTIRAIEYIVKKEKISDIMLRIIGEGDDLERLIALTESLQLSEYIFFNKSFIPLHEITREIQNADVGVISIQYDDFTRYMLPTKLLEYVFLQIPVICTRTNTIKAYFDETMVYYFTSGNVPELAGCIKDLILHPGKRMQFAKNAGRFTKAYNWDKQKEIYYTLVDSLINKKNALNKQKKNI